MATQTVPVISPRPGSAQVTPAIPTLRDFHLPPRAVAATSLTSKLAAALSLVGLAAVALLGLLVLSRRRELILLRGQIAQAMTFEARQRPLLATASAAASIPQPEPAATIHQAPRRWRRGILAVAAVPALAILVFLAVHFLGPDLSTSAAPPRASVPLVPVAIFNATSTPGGAHRLAGALKADRIHLGEVGNINASLRPGVYVFYPPGAQAEAQRVARAIPKPSPTIDPIQPQVQSAVGKQDEIVVIFD